MHLQAGLGEGGGFALLTGEVGTGKTTVSKALLASLNDKVKAGLILNPTFSESDLLEAICDEFAIDYPPQATLKQLTNAIHAYLLANHSNGLQTLLIIDEAQHLSTQVLEQLRLLTNLETESQKLLRVLLIGQPELQAKLQTSELRQLAQRITGRYHLLPLSENEVAQYIEFRLRIAGNAKALFSAKAVNIIARSTHGVPRLINLVCDKALTYCCQSGEGAVSVTMAQNACHDVMAFQAQMFSNADMPRASRFPVMFSAAMVAIIAVVLVFHFQPLISEQILVRLDAVPAENIEQKSELQNQDRVLTGFLSRSSSPIEAMQTLYRLWGLDASILEADCSADISPFFCERKRGDLNMIVAENRPVMLTLQYENEPYFVTLYALRGNKVELINQTQRISLPISELERMWNGEYQMVWYSEINQVLKLGSEGDAVIELDKLLAKALNEVPNHSEQFELALENRVKAFQSWQGLVADGVVGQNTLKVLDKLTTDSAPTLNPNKEPL